MTVNNLICQTWVYTVYCFIFLVFIPGLVLLKGGTFDGDKPFLCEYWRIYVDNKS